MFTTAGAETNSFCYTAPLYIKSCTNFCIKFKQYLQVARAECQFFFTTVSRCPTTVYAVHFLHHGWP